MTTLFGHSVRSERILLHTAEVLACFLAIYATLAWGAGASPAEGWRALAVAALLALSSGLLSGVTGLHQAEIWSRSGRLFGVALISWLLKLALAWPILLVLGPVGSEGTPWFRLVAALLALGLIVLVVHFAFAVALRHGLLTRRIALVRRPGELPSIEREVVASGGGGPLEIALAVPAGPSLAEALAPERLSACRIWAVVASDLASLPMPLRRRCEQAGVPVFSKDEFLEHRLNRIDPDRLPDDWLASARGIAEGPVEAVLRRSLEIGACLALVLLTLPLLLLTALAIKLDSRGPVFYRQERVGRGGRVFLLYKFRSMRVDAEPGGAACWASHDDPRVTRVGRLIRLTRIDEIPQVLNVLRGDMALVGPRPERPVFVEQLGRLIPHYHDRSRVKPGITGWAQVNYPYGASVEDARRKLAYDLYYVRRRSLFLDLLILLATIRVVLFQEGAR